MEQAPRKILVAMDASEQAFEAVRYVGRILPAGRARITLFHVKNVIPESMWDLESGPDFRFQVRGFGAWEVLQDRMIQELMGKAQRLLLSMGYAEADVTLRVREREAGVVRDIAEEAQQGYDALVLGRRGISELKDIVLGSTATRLLGRLPNVAIWVVGGSPDPGKVLVAMDNSAGAMRALDYVGRIFAGHFPEEVALFHAGRGLAVPSSIVEALTITEEGREWLTVTQLELQTAGKGMESRFQEGIRLLSTHGADVHRVSTRLVDNALSRSGAIVEEALTGGYGTIVVGRRGLSRVEEFIMGRVSSKVLQMARAMAVWVVH